MATDPDNIVIGGNATVRFAPVGTAVPTDLTTAYSGTWVDVGYLGEDGIAFDPSVDVNQIMAMQDFYPVRTIVTQRGLDITLPLLEWKKGNIELALGGGSVATTSGVHKYTPPAPEDVMEKAMAIAWADGDKDYRWHFARVMVTDLASFTLARTDPATLPITVAVMGATGVDPFHMLTDDPAFA
jgi:hypothetical protein